MQSKHYIKLIIGIIVIFSLLLLGQCSRNKEYIENIERNHSIDTAKLRTIIDKRGNKLVIKDSYIAKSKADEKKYIEEIENLKKIKNQTKVITKFLVQNVEVSIDRPVYITDSSTGRKFLQVPSSFQNKKEWYSLQGTITEKGHVLLDTLSMKSDATISVGYEKKKLLQLFKEPNLVVVYKEKNPYIKVDSLKNVSVEGNYPKLSVDVQAGYGITISGLSPYIGVGLSYKIRTKKRK